MGRWLRKLGVAGEQVWRWIVIKVGVVWVGEHIGPGGQQRVPRGLGLSVGEYGDVGSA